MIAYLVASPGGHLDELEAAVKDVFAPQERAWVTVEGHRADGLRERGESVIVLPEFKRDPRAAITTARAAARLVHERRPRLVVTTGAGAAVPFCLAARLAGARLFFVESGTRMRGPSLTGRALGPVATATLVQWPELATVFPRSQVCRPMLLDEISSVPETPRTGTFVTVGTHPVPFTRLFELVDSATRQNFLPEPITVQAGGARYRPVTWRSP